MVIQIRKAERIKSKLRLGLAGPSGSGKTMSSLKLAKGLVPNGKICMIDTERGSGDLYSHLFNYDIITLQPPYAPKNYVEAIEMAENAGYDVIIIDSLSHAWSDEGGLLDQADKLSAGGNRFTVWSSLTPQHRQLVNAMLNSSAHVIATVRSKQDYAIEKDEKTGRSSVKKLGLAPVQREGMEYEFTIFIDIDQNHTAHTSKDRTNLFKDEVFVIDEAIGERITSWLNEGKDDPKAKPNYKQKAEIMRLLKAYAGVYAPTTADDVALVVKNMTQLELLAENYNEIIARLGVLVKEKSDAAQKEPIKP